MTIEDAAPVVGFTYGGDFRSEEEYGSAAIAKGLRNGALSPEDVNYQEIDGIAVFTIVNPEERYMSDDAKQRATMKAIHRYKEFTPSNDFWRLQRSTVAELKERAKAAGVESFSKLKKNELISAIAMKESGGKKIAQGEFHAGDVLAIATDDPVEKALLAKLANSHKAGALRVGSSSNPFSRGIMFYDDRDVTPAVKENEVRHKVATKAAKAYVAETKNKLESVGHVFAVSPNVSDPLADIRETRYWLNMSPRVGNFKQQFGYYTKEELDAVVAGDYSKFEKE